MCGELSKDDICKLDDLIVATIVPALYEDFELSRDEKLKAVEYLAEQLKANVVDEEGEMCINCRN